MPTYFSPGGVWRKCRPLDKCVNSGVDEGAGDYVNTLLLIRGGWVGVGSNGYAKHWDKSMEFALLLNSTSRAKHSAIRPRNIALAFLWLPVGVTDTVVTVLFRRCGGPVSRATPSGWRGLDATGKQRRGIKVGWLSHMLGVNRPKDSVWCCV